VTQIASAAPVCLLFLTGDVSGCMIDQNLLALVCRVERNRFHVLLAGVDLSGLNIELR
jgi:hypothetical protein